MEAVDKNNFDGKTEVMISVSKYYIVKTLTKGAATQKMLVITIQYLSDHIPVPASYSVIALKEEAVGD
jgi:hypothetical protein